MYGRAPMHRGREMSRERIERFRRAVEAAKARRHEHLSREGAKREEPKARVEAKERAGGERGERRRVERKPEGERAAPRSDNARLLEELRRIRQQLQTLEREVDQLKAVRGSR